MVLTDVVMPEMGGEVRLRELRARAPEAKVVAMTGYVMDINLRELREAGFIEILPKPFSIEKLTQGVDDVFRT